MKVLCSLLLLALASAFDYSIDDAGSISLLDVDTGIGPIQTIFLDEPIDVSVEGLAWAFTGLEGGDTSIAYETYVDGKLAASGTADISDVNRELPSSISAGTVTVSSRGRSTIEVILTLDGETSSTSAEFEAFGNGMSIWPLMVVLIFAVTTRMVEFSMYFSIFVGSCMVYGNLKDGFTQSIENYILNALADVGHGYVYLFTLFLAGLVGMLEKSGGMIGFTNDVAKFATTARSGQFVAYWVGLFVFFDDYANTLLAGASMQPLTDLLFVSREKLAFIVDATAAPIASLTPVSSWVGYEVSLIEAELEKIRNFDGVILEINESALGVFLKSIKYRYYPIFMLIIIPMLIWTKRDFGAMLIAERKTQVYQRTDGGDGAAKMHTKDPDHKQPNDPEDDIPKASWNMIFPVLLLVMFIFYLLIKVGDDGSGDQDIMDKLQATDSYIALLWGTFAAAVCTIIFYQMQPVKDGHFVWPDLEFFKGWLGFTKIEEGESKPRMVMSIYECIEAFLYGMGRIFPALIVLTLAWAVGSVMTDVGVDRLFAKWIVGGISASALPTLSFIISAFMALATGTSWGTMAILFPILTVSSARAIAEAGGDNVQFYAVIAGILSGSVAGDHISPISDTTVLSALATDCKLLGHVSTQAPYAVIVIIVSIVLGTVPIGNDTWPNIIGILLGIVALGLFVQFYCKPIINADGSLDLLTELFMKLKGSHSDFATLKEDTIKAYDGTLTVHEGDIVTKEDPEVKELNDSDEIEEEA